MFHPLAQSIVSTLPGKSVCEFGNQRYGGGGEFKSVKDFYNSIGYNTYIAFDVNEDKDAMVMDLNKPVDTLHWLIDKRLPRTFDLVTNNGTGEHIFDQRSIYENAHNLSNRWMVHIMPMIPWINHGFFNYNPILYRDLAAANGYKAQVFIGNRWGKKIVLTDEELYREKRPKMLEKACDDIDGPVFVCAIFEHTDKQAFQLPFQGKYKNDIQDNSLRNRYA